MPTVKQAMADPKKRMRLAKLIKAGPPGQEMAFIELWLRIYAGDGDRFEVASEIEGRLLKANRET